MIAWKLVAGWHLQGHLLLEGPYLALQPAGVMESQGPEQLCWILRSAYVRDTVKDQLMDRQAMTSALTRP